MFKCKKSYTAAAILLAMTAGILLKACSENPVESVVSHERAIEDFRIDNQIGVPVIIRSLEDDDSHVTIFVQPDTDLSAVTPEITVSYKASVSPASGEEVNFAENDGQYTYEVTSESGRTREWLVIIEEFESNLAGTWEVTEVRFDYYFGEGEDWGWGEEGRPLHWDISDAENLLGNTFHFDIEGTDESGRNFGTFTQEGETADFGEWAYKFDRIPESEGTYHRDFSNDILIFEEGTENETRTMSLEFSADEQSLNIVFDLEPDIDWDTLENVTAASRFWYELVRVD